MQPFLLILDAFLLASSKVATLALPALVENESKTSYECSVNTPESQTLVPLANSAFAYADWSYSQKGDTYYVLSNIKTFAPQKSNLISAVEIYNTAGDQFVVISDKISTLKNRAFGLNQGASESATGTVLFKLVEQKASLFYPGYYSISARLTCSSTINTAS